MLTRNLVITYHYRISKLVWEKLWLVDTVIVRDHSPPLDQTGKNAVNHPFPEKSQPICQSCKKRKWDVVITGMKAQTTNLLCPIRYVACTYAWLKRETVFWSVICSFPSQLHCFLHTFSKINYSCVDFLVSFYHKYRVFYVVEYVYVSYIRQRKHRFKCSHS